MGDLWQAVVSGTLTPALPAFFPEAAYAQLKSLATDRGDWQNRLVAEYGGKTVLVVSHVTPIKTVLQLALDAGPNILYRLHLDLASLSIAEFYPDGKASVRLVNQTAYLN